MEVKIMDEEIYKIITDTYGTVYEPAPREQIDVLREQASEGMDIALLYFKKNPSAENFNLLKVAMLTYQYWVQKRVMQ